MSSVVFLTFLGGLSCTDSGQAARSLGSERRFSYGVQLLFEPLLWLSLVFSVSSERGVCEIVCAHGESGIVVGQI